MKIPQASAAHANLTAELNAVRSALVADAFKALLERRHLYQSSSVPVDSLSGFLVRIEKLTGQKIQPGQAMAAALLSGPWVPEFESRARKISFPSLHGMDEAEPYIPFKLQGARLMCGSCDHLNPYNVVSASDLLANLHTPSGEAIEAGENQLFQFALQCQGCKGLPEVILVSRRGLKLTITGRSPMEKVSVPSFIPKVHRQFLVDAIVAHNSGQTLAGIFFLRTLIEQFVRSSSSAPDSPADRLLDEYMASLSRDFRDRFPSLTSTYGQLSEAIHAANASAEVFERAMKDITVHFEGVDLFRRVAGKA